jgi:aminoglycoside phosphotransferase (APT) family kinase protein
MGAQSAAPDGLPSPLANLPQVSSGAWQVLDWHMLEARRRRGKHFYVYALTYLNGVETRSRQAQVFAKVYSNDRGAHALEAMRTLWAAGFRPPARELVTRPYGYLPGLNVLFQARAMGQTWADFLLADDRELAHASRRAGRWLAQLQRTPVAGTPADRREVLAIASWVEELSRTFPAIRQRLEPLAVRLEHTISSAADVAVPSHGDYHPKNVLMTLDGTTVIDFDTFGLRRPAFDVGYAIGQLLIMSAFRAGGFGPGARAALAFWGHYQRCGRAAWPEVAAEVARTFLQSLHYELCTLRNERFDLLERWPAMMEAWLDGGGPWLLEGLVSDC